MSTGPAPWALFNRPHDTFRNGQWLDGSGNSRHATGNPSVVANHLHFAASQTMTWPEGSVPREFTIFVRARYSPSGARQRILQGRAQNWLLGWWSGNVGVAHFGSWKTRHTGDGVCLHVVM